MTNLAIIGAGLAGISLAHLLQHHARITVFEKSRGISGRMSTRYADPYQFDHGAQYFTINDPGFRDFLTPYRNNGIILPWKPHAVLLSPERAAQPCAAEKDYFVAAPRMNSLVKAIAADTKMETHILHRVVSFSQTAHQRWQLNVESGKDSPAPWPETFDWVICTAPAPQAHDLLAPHGIGHGIWDKTHMQGCYSLMLGFETQQDFDFDAAYVENSPIGWIAVNSGKPGRKTDQSLLIQSTNEWAETHIEDDAERVTESLLQAFEDVVPVDKSRITYKSLHRWRYAGVQHAADTACLLDHDKKIAACGDWFVKGRVEGAFISAAALAKDLKTVL